MEVLLTVAVGGLITAGFYQMLQRSLVRLIIGLALLSHATNLLVFTAGGVERTHPPYIRGYDVIPPDVADPVPQALILTAIVIGFGTQAFAIVLIRRTYHTVGTDDLRQLTTTDRVKK